MIITNKIIKEIRSRLDAKQTYRDIARDLGVSTMTVYRYSSDQTVDRVKQREMEKWDRIKADPVKLEERRQRTREWARANRMKRNKERELADTSV